MSGKRLYRSRTKKWIAGVCGGLADYFEIDVMLVRLIFFLSLFINWIGFVAYLGMLILVPREQVVFSAESSGGPAGTGTSPGLQGISSTEAASVVSGAVAGDKRTIAGVAFVALGILFAARLGFPHLSTELFFGLAVIALGIYLIIKK